MRYLSNIDDFKIAVNKDLWTAVKNGDNKAIEELKTKINGLSLYFHNYIPDDVAVWVSIDNLIKHDIVRKIILYADVS